MIEDLLSFEDLLLATLEAVSRFRVGQRDAVSAARSRPGPCSPKPRARLQHGEWGNWLHRVGLAPRTASMWMKLAGMDLTAEAVIERGGNPKSATVADLPDSNLGRDLAEAEAAIADTKQAYYDALNQRHRAAYPVCGLCYLYIHPRFEDAPRRFVGN